MSEEQKHTELPWRREIDSGGRFIIIGGDTGLRGVEVCELNDILISDAQREDNGNFIVKAVNSYEKMRDALEEAREHLEYCGYGDKWERECAEESGLSEKIDEALAKGGQA